VQYIKGYRIPYLIIFIMFFTSNAQATAFSAASTTFDWEFFEVSGDVGIKPAELESIVTTNNEDGFEESIATGGLALTNELDVFNASAFAGNDGFDFLTSFTSSDSVIGDAEGSSASSFLSVLVPFYNYSTSGESVDVSFDYELLANAETDFMGEFSTSISEISFSLLDEAFNELDIFVDGLFLDTADGTSDDNFVSGFFSESYDGLAKGSYYFAVDTFAASFTEAISPSASVPAPGTLFLMAMGLFAIAKRKKVQLFNSTKNTAIPA